MNEDEERQEYDAVEEWAQNRSKAEVHTRIEELIMTNAYAREKLSQHIKKAITLCEKNHSKLMIAL